MKYANSVVLAGAMVWLVGCASAPRVVVVESVGPGPMAGSQGMGDGSLVIYSARTPANIDVNTETWGWNNDFGRNEFLYEPAHTDYTIYAQSGELFKHVRNARSMNDDTPTLVMLPAGSYKVEAEAMDCDSSPVKVLMTVVINPGQTTMAHLEGGWNPGGQDKQIELARLPCGRAIGWRAPEAGFASSQASSQAN
jgi:hypothetical protein